QHGAQRAESRPPDPQPSPPTPRHPDPLHLNPLPLRPLIFHGFQQHDFFQHHFMAGGGLSQEAGSVEQLSLHCAEGSLEWLYPTGALRLRLAPRLPPTSAALYLEREGGLELLLPEAPRPHARCFSWLPQEKVALFLQVVLGLAGACRPCNDTEILMAICTIIRGSIRSVSNDAELQESIIGVSATRIHRQKFPLFQVGGWPGRLVGSIRTPLRCGVRPGPGTFLFTGWLHFGEAWLSCAPRYRDFQRIYRGAQRTRQNPCEFPVD
uniref:Meteorin, glial cell differentiation regulator n=1 Tax=Serinus canaria TaxID=9135 RepID=A0A8C9NCR9_SERCA